MGASLLGRWSGFGGGGVRDCPLNAGLLVLRAVLYAVVALAGAAIVVIGERLGLPTTGVMCVGAVFCFSLRLLAIRNGWGLPVASSLEKHGKPRDRN